MGWRWTALSASAAKLLLQMSKLMQLQKMCVLRKKLTHSWLCNNMRTIIHPTVEESCVKCGILTGGEEQQPSTSTVWGDGWWRWTYEIESAEQRERCIVEGQRKQEVLFLLIYASLFSCRTNICVCVCESRLRKGTELNFVLCLLAVNVCFFPASHDYNRQNNTITHS